MASLPQTNLQNLFAKSLKSCQLPLSHFSQICFAVACINPTSTALNTIVRSQVHPSRLSKLVPPLKDIPDEIFQDSGEDSDFKANKLEIEQ